MGKPYGISGTPWHITSGDRKKGERRHQSRCEHFRKGDETCWCRDPQNHYYGIKCPGSAHCDFYTEKNI